MLRKCYDSETFTILFKNQLCPCNFWRFPFPFSMATICHMKISVAGKIAEKAMWRSVFLTIWFAY